MNIISKKGYVLLMTFIFTFILMVVSMGIYASIRHFVVDIRVREVGYIRGYYAGIAGLRYAAILLRDPVGLFGDTTHDDGDPPYNVTGTELGGNFFTDIGVDSSRLTITITEWSSAVTDPEWTDGEYNVATSYTYAY